MTELFNRSLSTGRFPAEFRQAFITPIVKKPGLDATDASSYRPISNLSLLSKPRSGWLSVWQLMEYMSSLVSRSSASAAICVSTRSLNWNSCSTCAVRYFAGYRPRRVGCPDPLGFIGSFRYGGLRYPTTALTEVCRYQRHRSPVVSVLLAAAVTSQ